MGDRSLTATATQVAVPPAEAGGAVGLSHGHIFRKGSGAAEGRPADLNTPGYLGPAFYFTIAHGSEFAQVKAAGFSAPKPGSPPRREVRGLSEKSRRRLIKKLAALDKTSQKHKPVFITLTYPDVWPEAPAEWHAHLKNFCQRVRYKFPHACIIWRLEYQERGAPHFHLILLGPRFLDYSWVAEKWNAVVAKGNEQHLAAGTETRAARNWGETQNYLAKYVAKQLPHEHTEATGRQWGIYGRDNLPIYLETYMVPDAFFRWVRACLVEQRKELTDSDWLPGPYNGVWATAPPDLIAQWLEWAEVVGTRPVSIE